MTAVRALRFVSPIQMTIKLPFSEFDYSSGFQTGGRDPRGSQTIFGGVASRYLMYTVELHLMDRVVDGCGSSDYRGLL